MPGLDSMLRPNDFRNEPGSTSMIFADRRDAFAVLLQNPHFSERRQSLDNADSDRLTAGSASTAIRGHCSSSTALARP